MRLVIAAAILLVLLGWTGSSHSQQPDPAGVLQSDDGEIIPLCDPQTLAEGLQKMRELFPPPPPGGEVAPPTFPPPSPATGLPGVKKCRLPGAYPFEPLEPPRFDLPVPGAVSSPCNEECCRKSGLNPEDLILCLKANEPK